MEFTKKFNGKLTEEELTNLKKAGITDRQIYKIEEFMNKYKNVLSGFSDLVGDDLVPQNKLFFFNIKHIGYLLDEDPDKTLSRTGVKVRKMTTARLIKFVGGSTMASNQIFENRNELKKEVGTNAVVEPDNGIVLPDEPVIWAPNHHFKDDAMATMQAAKRPFYFMFGSLPLYFNTFDGVLAFLNGTILINRKNKNSKRASLIKASKAIDYGADLFWAVEATHNKSANELMLEPWNGIYRLAQEKGTKVVPVSHYLIDPTRRLMPKKLNPIHTVIDDPIDLTAFPSEKSALNYLRDVISTWYYLMMDKYGRMTREELFKSYEKRAMEYGVSCDNLIKRPLTSAEIGTLYNLDLRSTVTGYDSIAEIGANFRDKSIARPEAVFENIANIQNPRFVQEALYAKRVVRERKYEDYQKRF